jgi:rhodanese-related sulfurtransferase
MRDSRSGAFSRFCARTRVLEDSWRIVIVVFSALLLGLAVNAFHPQSLPLTLAEAKRPGIPLRIWKRLRFTDAQKAFEMAARGENALLVDVRDRKDYEQSHGRGAVSLPYHGFDRTYPEFASRVPLEKRILLYCYGTKCGMSARVATRLVERGYANVVIVRNGFAGWTAAGLPVAGERHSE